MEEDGEDPVVRFDWLERSTAWTMRLARWHPALVLPIPIVLGVLIALAIRNLHRATGLVAGLVACGIVAWVHGMLVTMRDIALSLDHAREEHDETRVFFLRQLIEGSPITASDYLTKHIGDAEAWIRMRQFERAARSYEQIDLDLAGPTRKPGLMGGHALAMAHSGEPGRALLLVDMACATADRTPRYPEHKRRLLEQRRGVILSLAGRHEEALAVLAPFEHEEDDTSTSMTDLIVVALARSRAALA